MMVRGSVILFADLSQNEHVDATCLSHSFPMVAAVSVSLSVRDRTANPRGGNPELSVRLTMAAKECGPHRHMPVHPLGLSRFKARDVVELSGESDVCDAPFIKASSFASCVVDDGGLGVSCKAEVKVWCRMARMQLF